MTDIAEPVATEPAGGELAHDSIGLTEDVVLGMATSAPAVSVAVTIAALVAAVAYGSGPIIVITAIPMLIIANAYRRLNLWDQTCGAAYQWVAKAIDPNLGFLTGWIMIAAYVIATVSGVEVLGPSVIAVFSSGAGSTWGNIAIATAVGVGMVGLSVIGIKITARTQTAIAVVEYTILAGFAIAGLIAVADHMHGTVHFSGGWLSPTGIGGHGSATAGFLIALFMFTGWDGAVYVNEETRESRVNPGRAAIIAVAALAVMYTLAVVGLQGTVSPAKLQAHSGSALIYTAHALGGSGWSKVMALALALSVIATTGAGILVTARIVFAMGRDRVLPSGLAAVSHRFGTPALATAIVGGLVVALTWVYLLATSLQNAFNDVVDVAGILYGIFYILTALATIVYYRRRLRAGVRDAVAVGVLPLAAAAFLGWVVVKSIIAAPSGQIWSLVGVVVTGLLLLAVARLHLRAPLFSLRRESAAD